MRRNREMWLALFGALLLAGTLGARAQDVVRPEVAFPYTLEANADAIELRFAVLDGYYLYRDRFGFATTSPGIRLGAPRFPRGEDHEDEFFGKQEIYRHEFTITLPYERTGAVATMDFELKLQGCADIGLCYPPQTWPSTVALPVAAAGADAGRALFGSSASDEPLPVEQAFVPNPRFDRANELTVSFAIEPGYYLYRQKFEFSADGEIELGNPRLPEGIAHTDLNFGDVEVFYANVEIVVPFARARPDAVPVTIHAVYQGCKEDSICYPPTETAMALTLPAGTGVVDAGGGTETAGTITWNLGALNAAQVGERRVRVQVQDLGPDDPLVRVAQAAPLTTIDKAEQPLITAWGTNGNPVWSPDGTKVAFVSNRGDHTFIGVYDSRTRSVSYLAPSVDHDTSPTWSPDSKRIAFVRRPGTPFGQQVQAGGGGIGNPPGPAAAQGQAAGGRAGDRRNPGGDAGDRRARGVHPAHGVCLLRGARSGSRASTT